MNVLIRINVFYLAPFNYFLSVDFEHAIGLRIHCLSLSEVEIINADKIKTIPPENPQHNQKTQVEN